MAALTAWARVAGALLVSVAWMVVSSFLILLNKHIMVDIGFAYPVTVSTLGMLGSSVLSFMCCHVFRIVKCEAQMSLNFWITRILPVGLCMALTLWCGNEVYLHLTVAFIQMLKAFVPVMVMTMLFVARLEDPTRKIIASVVITAAGTAIAAYGEVNFSAVGLAFMFFAELFEATRMVATQYLLTGLKFHPIEGLMYLAPACCIWTITGASAAEIPRITRDGGWAIMAAHPWLFIAATVMGFAVNGLAYYTIKLASALTLKVLATVKNTLLVVVGVIFLGEVVTGLQAFGYAVALFGFAWYQQIKISQIAAPVPGSGSPQPTSHDDEKAPLVGSPRFPAEEERGGDKGSAYTHNMRSRGSAL
ncbi:hypothetical protein FOA52_014410 [Chlamydomonas sp. UWO 241]|nr:hypothetical protein FOA52_014410 [Chlamydomonas sp. UWO 241]